MCVCVLHIDKFGRKIYLHDELLHDIKGHLLNLFHELPSVLPTSIRAECQGRINICLQKPKKSAGDLRATLVQLFMMIHTHASQVNWKVHLLLQSITIVCKILYANDCERCPKLLLQLYNNTWIHHQLCFDLFQSTTVVSRGTFFGLYLHALCKHAPEQYELVCLKSVNTENQERMFGQSRLIAEHTTNRHPDNIITSILMHMQVKNEIYKTTNSSETVVSVAATCLPEFNGTFVPLDWVNRRQDSWQAHLKRISPFLACGKGEWWTQSDKGYLFHDGKSDSSYNLKGPDLLHFRDSSIEAVYRRQEECWECIIDDRIELPTKSVKLYTKNGEYTSTRHTAVEFIPSTSDEMPHPSTMHPSTSDQMSHPSSVHPSTSDQTSHPSTVHPSASNQMSHPSSVHPSTSDQTSHPSSVHPSASDQTSILPQCIPLPAIKCHILPQCIPLPVIKHHILPQCIPLPVIKHHILPQCIPLPAIKRHILPQCIPLPAIKFHILPQCIPLPVIKCHILPQCIPLPVIKCHIPPQCIPLPAIKCHIPPQCIPLPAVKIQITKLHKMQATATQHLHVQLKMMTSPYLVCL